MILAGKDSILDGGMKNETITVSFESRTAALAYYKGVRMLANLCPTWDIRITPSWTTGVADERWRVHVHGGDVWRVYVQCLAIAS
jgi:hypothetical protein